LKVARIPISALVLVLLVSAAGCGQSLPQTPRPQSTPMPGDEPRKTYQDLIVGYAQIGAESEWRTGNTESVKEAARQLGVELKFSTRNKNRRTRSRPYAHSSP